MNTTANGSSWSCSSLINSSALKIVSTVGYSLILVVSLVGNSLIGLIVYKTPTLRKPINYLISNMAMSDLLFPLILIPWRVTQLHAGSWLIGGSLGQALCKLSQYLPDVSYSVSVQSQILIAVDRFVAVVFPFRSPPISRKLFPFFIIATWIVALAFHTPVLISANVIEYTGGKLCGTDWYETFGESWPIKNQFLAVYTAFVCIPIVLLVILYSIILIKLKLQAHPGEQSTNVEKQRARRNRNVLRMAIAIVFAFFFCLIPYTTSIFILVHESIHSSIWCGFRLFFIFAFFMFHANCAMNPLICLIFSSNYRHGLKRLLKC